MKWKKTLKYVYLKSLVDLTSQLKVNLDPKEGPSWKKEKAQAGERRGKKEENTLSFQIISWLTYQNIPSV